MTYPAISVTVGFDDFRTSDGDDQHGCELANLSGEGRQHHVSEWVSATRYRQEASGFRAAVRSHQDSHVPVGKSTRAGPGSYRREGQTFTRVDRFTTVGADQAGSRTPKSAYDRQGR